METATSTSPQDLTRNYLVIFSGQLISQLGSSIIQFVLIWYITATTNSGLALSIAALLGFGSYFITNLFAGVLADRYDRKLIMLITDLLQALAAAVLMYLFFIGTAELNHIYGLLFIRGLLGGIQAPASQAIRPSMVPKERLSQINSFTSFASSLLNLGTPVIAAVLLGIFGLQNLFALLAIDAITFAIGVIPLLAISIPKDHISIRKQQAKNQKFRDEFLEGLVAIRQAPGMIALLISFALTNFFLSGAITFLPLVVYSPVGLAGNELILALGFTGIQGGNLLITFILMKKKITKGLVKKLTLGIMGGFAGMAIAGLGVVFQFIPIFVAGFILLGLSIPIAAISSSVIWQSYYPNELQGRVWTVRATISTIMTPLSFLSIGLVTELFPVSLRYLLLTFGMIGLVMYLSIYHFTSIRQIDDILELGQDESDQDTIQSCIPTEITLEGKTDSVESDTQKVVTNIH